MSQAASSRKAPGIGPNSAITITADGAEVRTTRTMCRICVGHCGLLVTTMGDQVVEIKADQEHPLSHGYTCPKGRNMAATQHDPRRLDHATIGRGDERRKVAPEELVDDLGARLAAIVEEHGPDAVAFYWGSGGVLDAAGGSLGRGFANSLGTQSVYTTATLDTAGRETSYRLMQGRSPMFPTYDEENCEFLVLFGLNPVISHGQSTCFPDPGMRLSKIARKGQVWVFDPRRSESAHLATQHVSLRPGSDYAVLAFTIRELLREGADEEFIERWTTGVDVLRQAVEPYTAEAAAEIADVDESILHQFVAALRQATSVVVQPGTGIGFSPFPSVSEWLVLALNIVTGSIEKPGGVWFNPGFWSPSPEHPDSVPPADDSGDSLDFRAGRGSHGEAVASIYEPAPGPPSRPDLESWVEGQRPMAGISDEIFAGNVRALFVQGGNPVNLTTNLERAKEAFANLEVLAVADIMENEMTELATHVLPCAYQLERDDATIVDHMSFGVFGQYAEAALPLRADRRPQWWYVSQVARHMGIELLPDSVPDEPTDRDILRAIYTHPRIPFDEVASSPGGRLIEIDRRPWFTEHGLPTGRWDLAPERLVRSMSEIVPPPSDGLVLTTRRQRYHMNTVQRDVQEDRPDGAAVSMNPDDATQRSLVEGDVVVVRTKVGSLTLPVHIDTSMRRGTVSIPHGYRGTNVNAITDDRDLLDFSGMPRFSTLPITVEKAG